MNLEKINENLQIAKQEMEEIISSKETDILRSLDKSISVCEECHHSIASHNGLCDRCYKEAMEGMENFSLDKDEPDYDKETGKLTKEHLSDCAGCANCSL
jgi:hypothetical protein